MLRIWKIKEVKKKEGRIKIKLAKSCFVSGSHMYMFLPGHSNSGGSSHLEKWF